MFRPFHITWPFTMVMACYMTEGSHDRSWRRIAGISWPQSWAPGSENIQMGNTPTQPLQNTPHRYTLDDTKILMREEKWFPRKIREAFQIHKRSPALNQRLPFQLVYSIELIFFFTFYWLNILLNVFWFLKETYTSMIPELTRKALRPPIVAYLGAH